MTHTKTQTDIDKGTQSAHTHTWIDRQTKRKAEGLTHTKTHLDRQTKRKVERLTHTKHI